MVTIRLKHIFGYQSHKGCIMDNIILGGKFFIILINANYVVAIDENCRYMSRKIGLL